MKQKNIIITAIVLVAALSLSWVGLASAFSFQSGNHVTYEKGQVVDNTVFAAGNTVDIASEVFGDVFCAGQNVTVSGIIHGDVICAGQTLVISGRVEGDVRAAGQTVTLSGEVTGNASVGAQTFTQSETSTITGDLSLGASTATIKGTVNRDLAAGGGTITVGGTVGRDIQGMMQQLELASSAKVGGDITFNSDQEISRADGATVAGTVTRSDLPQEARPDPNAMLFGVIFWAVSLLLTALVLVLLSPRLFQRVSQHAINKPGKVILIGFAAHIAMPVLLILLTILFVGLPLAFILLLVWLLSIVTSWIFFAYYIGRMLMKDTQKPVLIMLAGASLVIIVGLLPILGILVFLVGLWFGTGMIVAERFMQRDNKLADATSKEK